MTEPPTEQERALVYKLVELLVEADESAYVGDAEGSLKEFPDLPPEDTPATTTTIDGSFDLKHVARGLVAWFREQDQ